MANLSITTACNRDCSYCFARTARSSVAPAASYMTLDFFDAALDFLLRSGIDRVRLLGGEPTIHPHFPEMVARGLARGFRVLVFSNGLMPEPAIRSIEETPAGAVRVLVNASGEPAASGTGVPRQEQILRRLGARATLSVNLHHAGCDPSFALDWIRRFGLAPNVRLGLAHPSIGSRNSWLRPRQYRAVGQTLAGFAADCKQQGVAIDFDCGFVPCMFPEEALDSLGLAAAALGGRCSPVLDILSDGRVVNCYPLAGFHTERLTPETDAGGLRRTFEDRFSRYRAAGVFPHCSACTLKQRGACLGGCLAAAMERMHPAGPPQAPALRAERPAPPRAPVPAAAMERMHPAGPAQPPALRTERAAPPRAAVPAAAMEQMNPAVPPQAPALRPERAAPPHGVDPAAAMEQMNPAVTPQPPALRAERAAPPRAAVPLERIHPSGPAELPAPRATPDPAAAAAQRLWAVPYIDQPLDFWHRLREDFGASIRSVYLPLPAETIGSGRPPQPSEHAHAFLESAILPVNVLVNPAVLPEPVERIAPRVIDRLQEWCELYGIQGATVANVLLARKIRQALPHLELAASTLLEIATPAQAFMIDGVFDVLVPSGRAMRDLAGLRALRAAFPGRLRLIVNEACLPGCPYRTQHFHEMAAGVADPQSLCHELLEREPWLRLTGAWVLPQHLHLYDGLYDELKLAGRVTLRDPARYRRVLGAYIARAPLQPHEIGGGPASVDWPAEISEQFFRFTLECGHACGACTRCRELARPFTAGGA